MRVIACPHCDMKYRIDPAKFPQPELKIRCKGCGGAFSVDLSDPNSQPVPGGQAAAKATPAPTPQAAPQQSAAPVVANRGGKTALVAHDQDALRNEMAAMLRDAGFTVTTVSNGVEALMHIENHRPAVAVLDVTLPKMFGFEVCEIVRRDAELSGVRLILIAAIYDKTKYKREPTNLYGADDYIEKHSIPETLVEKCLRLVGETAEPKTPEPPAASTAPTPAPATAAAASIDPDLLNRARRLARTIISDISLYHQEKILEGAKKNNAHELLAPELAEGQTLFESRISESVRQVEPFLVNALNDFIANKRKELGL